MFSSLRIATEGKFQPGLSLVTTGGAEISNSVIASAKTNKVTLMHIIAKYRINPNGNWEFDFVEKNRWK